MNFFFILSTFDKHDKTQLLAKFKKILYMGFRATLNFRKFKMALNPLYIFWETCDFRKKKKPILCLVNIFKFAVSFVHILDLVKCSVTPPKGTLFRFYI